MSRLEIIKDTLIQYADYEKEGLVLNASQTRYKEHIEYLLQLVERYETVLKEVTVSTSHNHALYIVDNALKE